MTFKRFMALALSLTLLLCALPQLTVVSYAQTATTSGCPYSTDGRHSWGQWETDVPGTCVTKERLVRKCKLCGALDYWTKDYGDHDWGEGIVTKQPTATEDGEMTYTCKNDPTHIKTEPIPATGREEKPALSITLWAVVFSPSYEKTTEIPYGDDFHWWGSVTNTGNTDIELYDCDKKTSDGWSRSGSTIGTRYLLKPGETVEEWNASLFLSLVDKAIISEVNPSTETETLAGTITYTVTVPGYRPGTDEVICSDTASYTIGVLKPEDDGLHPGMTVTLTADPGAGEGKRIEGAWVTYYLKITNTGDCPIYTLCSDAKFDEEKRYNSSCPNGNTSISESSYPVALLYPGESCTQTIDELVIKVDVADGIFNRARWYPIWFFDANNSIAWGDYVRSNDLDIPLTYPDGEEQEEKKPELTVIWDYDSIVKPGGSYYDTNTPGILNPEDSAYAYHTVKNTGNMALKYYGHFLFGDGSHGISSFQNGRHLYPNDVDSGTGTGSKPLQKHLTPGTETDELMGTVTVTIWAVGCDLKTGEELCKSNEITRTWKVGKPTGDWEIPEGSRLTASLKVRPGYESSDPAGYQLGEEYATVLYVKNTGLVDLESYTVTDPWDGSTFTAGPIAVNEEQSFARASGTVKEEDVAAGRIELPMITVGWTDPDSEADRTTFAGPLKLTVLSKTGLLVKKSVANAPANGQYFTEGETIKWKLTVTNNSGEPIKNVTVTDKGKVVGTFSEIVPGETVSCAVPDTVVTEYDEIVGKVTNSAVAKGTDGKDTERSYPSNTATALTDKPEPETDTTKKDTGDPGEKHIDLEKLKTGGDEDEDKKTGDGDDEDKTDDEDEDRKTDGAGDCCRLTLEALGENEALYTLHACAEHIDTAEAAEELALVKDWAGAADIWRGALNELYELLIGVSDETGIEALTADREALWAYADACAALFGDEAAADLLRVRLAELCCMIHTAPQALPGSISKDCSRLVDSFAFDASSRTVGLLLCSDSDVREQYAGLDAEANSNTRRLLDGTAWYREQIFAQAQNNWQEALDEQVNEIYLASEKDQKKMIAAWRKSLDALRKADRNLYELLYTYEPATTEELIMDLYKDAAVLADSLK